MSLSRKEHADDYFNDLVDMNKYADTISDRFDDLLYNLSDGSTIDATKALWDAINDRPEVWPGTYDGKYVGNRKSENA
jgi:hypothetical protein